MVSRKASTRWPARPRPTPRGIKGTRLVVYIDAIVQKYVPLEDINACIASHQRGTRVAVVHPRWKEPVYKTICEYPLSPGKTFTWWAVSFPLQRRLFLGPPEFFAKGMP